MNSLDTPAEQALLHQDIRSITAKFIVKNYASFTLDFVLEQMLHESHSCATWLEKLARRYADNGVPKVSDRLSELSELARLHGI